MKLIKINLLLISLLIMQSCGTTKKKIFWVSGFKTECSSGAGKMTCFNVYKGEDLNNPVWENFYAPIEGFEFEEGFLKKIEVKEETLKNVPADASSIKYTMVKELEKQPDYRTLINGKWILNRLNNNPINKSIRLPILKINLNEMQFNGSGGCNNYTGKINKLTTKNIQLSKIVSTLKACFIKHIEQEYYNALNLVETYQVKGDALIFYTKEGKELLSFLKTNSAIN